MNKKLQKRGRKPLLSGQFLAVCRHSLVRGQFCFASVLALQFSGLASGELEALGRPLTSELGNGRPGSKTLLCHQRDLEKSHCNSGPVFLFLGVKLQSSSTLPFGL